MFSARVLKINCHVLDSFQFQLPLQCQELKATTINEVEIIKDDRRAFHEVNKS